MRSTVAASVCAVTNTTEASQTSRSHLAVSIPSRAPPRIDVDKDDVRLVVHGERACLVTIWRKPANFEAQSTHCGFEVKRYQKLILDDEDTAAAPILNVNLSHLFDSGQRPYAPNASGRSLCRKKDYVLHLVPRLAAKLPQSAGAAGTSGKTKG